MLYDFTTNSKSELKLYSNFLMMRITVLSVILLVLTISYQACDGEPSTGPDGSIVWDPMPSLGSFVVKPEQYKTDESRPAKLADMSSGWVDFVQPEGFPLDYIVHLIQLTTGDLDGEWWDEVKLGLKNFVGIFVCFFFGIFCFLFVPWIGLIFFCCRCCNNCGGKREQETSKLCCRQTVYTLFLAMSLAVLCAGAVSINTSDNFMTTAKDASFQTSLDIIGDAQTFTYGCTGQATHILEVEYNYVEQLTLSDLQNAGKLIAMPVQSYILEEVKVQALFDQFEKFINDVDNTNTTLHDIDSSRNVLISGGNELNALLTNVSVDLDRINAACAGCVPANNGLTVNIDYTQLPAVTDQMDGADTAKRNIVTLYNQGIQALDQIASDIDSVAQSPIADVEQIINTTSASVADLHNIVKHQLSTVSDQLGDAEDEVKAWHAVADQYTMYRKYATLSLSLSGLVIFSILAIGCIMGTVFHKNVDPRRRSAGSNCCGNFLIFGVVLTFLLTPLLMLFTSVFFVSLAPVSLTCKPLKNLELFKETVDHPDLISPGYWLAEIVLGNASIPLNVSSVLEDCDKNSTIYTALKLQHVINVDDLEKVLSQLRNQTGKLLDVIDISDLDMGEIVPDNLHMLLQAAVDQIKLQNIDFLTLETQLGEDVTTDDLLAYSKELDVAADDAIDPNVKADLKKAAVDLVQIQHSSVQPMQDIMMSMLSDTNHIKDLMTQLELDVNETSVAGGVAEAGLNDTNALETKLEASVQHYINVVIGYLDQFVDIALIQLIEQFGSCYPIRAMYDAAINLTCHYVLDSLNIMWFALGWCVFWMIVSLIFTVKLAKYFRIMKYVKIPKTQVGIEEDARQRAYTDSETGMGNYHSNQREQQERIHLNDNRDTNDAPSYLPPPSYNEAVGCYFKEDFKEVQC